MAVLLPRKSEETSPAKQYMNPDSLDIPPPKKIALNSLKLPKSKKELELFEKKQKARSFLPLLSKKQTRAHLNTYFHTLCVNLLSEGYHKSFKELSGLIKQQQQDRLKAGRESILWTKTMLDKEPEKLDLLKEYLSKAEHYHRKGDFSEVYKARNQLGQSFQETGDKWLSDHFFSTCLNISHMIKTDQGKSQAEANCNVAKSLEENGYLFEATKKYEEYNRLTAGFDWYNNEGVSLHIDACTHLCRVATKFADQQLEKKNDLENTVVYLKKAYDRSLETENKNLIGKTAYRLGLIYMKKEDPQTALSYLLDSLKICEDTANTEGIGKACDVISKAYTMIKNVDKSIEYLEKYVQVAEASNQDQALCWACYDLGMVYNAQGNYDKAVEYFNKAYNIARALNGLDALNASRVQLGISLSHKMNQQYVDHLKTGKIINILNWKSLRDDYFTPLPTEDKITQTSSESLNKELDQSIEVAQEVESGNAGNILASEEDTEPMTE